jgi:hypothetical protein
MDRGLNTADGSAWQKAIKEKGIKFHNSAMELLQIKITLLEFDFYIFCT